MVTALYHESHPLLYPIHQHLPKGLLEYWVHL